MKIVDISEFYSETGGGVRTYVHEKLDAASRHGHELIVVAPGTTNRVEEKRGGKIIWVACPAIPFDRNYRMFWRAQDVWRVLDDVAPDVVEGSSPWRGGWIAGSWPGDAAKALVFHTDAMAVYPYTFLGGTFSRSSIDRFFGWYWRYLRRLSGHFDTTVTGGEWLAERLKSFNLHCPTAVPFGVERERFSPAHRDANLRRDLLALCGAPEDGHLLLAVGRMHPEKRFSTIIKGFAQAKSRWSLGLVIVGDGFARAATEKKARRVGNVYLTGFVRDRDELARYYASADVLVHGSGAETFGLVVAEAISSGLAVVVPDSGGAADLASSGRSQTYATGDPESCALAIERLLDPAHKIGVPASPRPIVSLGEHFSALFAHYENLVAARKSGRSSARG